MRGKRKTVIAVTGVALLALPAGFAVGQADESGSDTAQAEPSADVVNCATILSPLQLQDNPANVKCIKLENGLPNTEDGAPVPNIRAMCEAEATAGLPDSDGLCAKILSESAP